MSSQESREAAVGIDTASARPIPDSGVIFESRALRPRKKRSSAPTILRGMILAHLENHPEKPFDYTKARKVLGVTKQWMWEIRHDLEADGNPMPQSTWDEVRAQNAQKEAQKKSLSEARIAKQAGRSRIVAQVRVFRERGLGPKGIKRFTDLPVSERKLRRINEELRKREGVAKLRSDKKTPDELREYDMRVRNLYNLRYMYTEIAKWLGEENLSNINNSLTRLEASGEIVRRHKRQGKKDSTTSSS